MGDGRDARGMYGAYINAELGRGPVVEAIPRFQLKGHNQYVGAIIEVKATR